MPRLDFYLPDRSINILLVRHTKIVKLSSLNHIQRVLGERVVSVPNLVEWGVQNYRESSDSISTKNEALAVSSSAGKTTFAFDQSTYASDMSGSCSSAHNAFFYGTLMAPSVLHRVTRRPLHQPFRVHPAILHGFRRHRVKDADYPAVLPSQEGSSSRVHGTFVQGLTDKDIFALDVFEGDEYERRQVMVELLDDSRISQRQQRPRNLENDRQELGSMQNEALAASEPEDYMADAEVYVWIREQSYLDDKEWNFDEFVKERLHMWAPSSSEYQEVDRALEAISVGGNVNIEGEHHTESPRIRKSENNEGINGQIKATEPLPGIGWRQGDPTGGRNINSKIFEAELGSNK